MNNYFGNIKKWVWKLSLQTPSLNVEPRQDSKTHCQKILEASSCNFLKGILILNLRVYTFLQFPYVKTVCSSMIVRKCFFLDLKKWTFPAIYFWWRFVLINVNWRRATEKSSFNKLNAVWELGAQNLESYVPLDLSPIIEKATKEANRNRLLRWKDFIFNWNSRSPAFVLQQNAVLSFCQINTKFRASLERK